ncbi:MAG: beta-N-acetylhexosaminidase [Candidatus Omnitrophica bacterium]|nr:beta-N-acetylhexosaminidase [Candidatus Omnitrophota bacterium]
MTLEDLVGLQLVVGIPGTSLTPDVAAHLRAIHAGGFIAFERNFHSPEQFQALVSQLNDTLGRAVWVMVDHEGGRVIRFAKGVTRFPDALTVGATQKPEEIVRQGALEAQELRGLGVHVNLAPCVDVLVEGADPVIGTRSYGSDPHRVAALATARIQGMQTHGLAACAKHFPGLGAVPKDPHKQLPTVGLEWPAMRQTHLVPFTAAIQTGVATVMSSHVCYPKLDPSNVPATWSARLIRELLRGELGFSGLMLTDDLEMGALHQLAPIGEAAVRAVAAGHDVALACSNLHAQRQVFEALLAAYLNGRLSVKELERSVAKLTALRQQLSLSI